MEQVEGIMKDSVGYYEADRLDRVNNENYKDKYQEDLNNFKKIENNDNLINPINALSNPFKDFKKKKLNFKKMPASNTSPRSKATFKGVSTNTNTPTGYRNRLKHKLKSSKKYETEEETANIKNNPKGVHKIRSTNHSSKRFGDFINLKSNQESKLQNEIGASESKKAQLLYYRTSPDCEQSREDEPKSSEKSYDKEPHKLSKGSFSVVNDDYVSESRLFDYTSLKQSPNFRIIPMNNAVYKGEVFLQDLGGGHSQEIRHGFGVMIYKNGRLYEGQWISNKRNGKGYERYKNNNIYEGDFKDGKAHGGGVFKWQTGETYDGQWHLGLKQGQGVWRGLHGEYYIGEWKDSRTHGKGIYVWSNRDKYEGEWRNGLKHGQGSDIFKNGDVYIGQYESGKPHGEGQYTWKNGSVYIGQFSNGMKHGEGKWIKDRKANSNTYVGKYYLDKKQGYGEFRWASGNVYQGNYKNDLRNGYGEMVWTDGSAYKGNWVNGIQHGYGKMELIDGTVNEGIFSHNIFQGENANSNEINQENQEDECERPRKIFTLENSLIEEENIRQCDEEYEEDETTPLPYKHLKSPKINPKMQEGEFESIGQEIPEPEEEAHIIAPIDREADNTYNKNPGIRDQGHQHNDNQMKDPSLPRSNKNIGTRNMNPLEYEVPKEMADFGAQFSSTPIPQRQIKEVTIQADLDNSPTMLQADLVRNQGDLLCTNLNVQNLKKSQAKLKGKAKRGKIKKDKIALDPDQKLKLLSTSGIRHLSPAGNISVPKAKNQKKGSQSNIFSTRTKTISCATGTNHGASNRQSRMRNLSKARFNSPERSGEENNMTYFPQLNNKINLHPNFDMPKAFKKHRKNRNKAIRDSLSNFAHKSVMDNHHSQGSLGYIFMKCDCFRLQPSILSGTKS
ncbi:unnamed protein product [Moneuplotes crassus]|uniref:Phosphatidylinositol-4-phosphate 5-kinase n=1 Tax=Euplotes crassus TaxID=5936 RepID=A0AAD1XXW7_EUPCR|nr:unnamed protein product [Moneuplotes crassus]